MPFAPGGELTAFINVHLALLVQFVASVKDDIRPVPGISDGREVRSQNKIAFFIDNDLGVFGGLNIGCAEEIEDIADI